MRQVRPCASLCRSRVGRPEQIQLLLGPRFDHHRRVHNAAVPVVLHLAMVALFQSVKRAVRGGLPAGTSGAATATVGGAVNASTLELPESNSGPAVGHQVSQYGGRVRRRVRVPFFHLGTPCFLQNNHGHDASRAAL
jgi:hypothetical protein